ncbi:MAG: hypothetical protein ACXVFN_04140 [Solirubrobacteraceae bacterium]
MPDLTSLAETARDAVGGGVVLTLVALTPDRRTWRATVAERRGHREVWMQLDLGTVEVHPPRARGMRRRGAPGCRMPGCPPRSRRPA